MIDSCENADSPDAAPLPIANASESSDGAAGRRFRLVGASPELLRAWLSEAGFERYRTDQLLDWIYRKRVERFDEMSNLSRIRQAWLTENAVLYRSTIARDSHAADGTRKLLLTWPDGGMAETVWIPSDRRNTACLSSQVGCGVGCRFCASGIDGVQRNLEVDEILEQALRISRAIDAVARDAGATDNRGGKSRSPDDAGPDRLSHIVFMGMGEPLANYNNVVAAIRVLNALWGLGIGARKITLSTVGLPKQIRRLADEDLQINLALSLHAPDDALRAELIPWARGIPLAELLDACAEYFKRTGREITLEYVLLAGVNDHDRQAEALARIARRLRANVNLLRYNPVPDLPFERPSSESAYRFQTRLRDNGVNAHVRTSRGRDVDAACGQLRRSTLSAQEG